MAGVRLLNAGGDTQVAWDPGRLAQADPEALAAVREAERLVDEARARGAQAFRLRPGAPAERIDALDPYADEEVIVIPPLVGG